ncbi:MAG: MBL fold metallo-hydrolase [Candidatus Methanofastidiosa archaeon]|nr:MBL fold metallo-hydrolase [Candidatus Methanofastidiosa archaeon]
MDDNFNIIKVGATNCYLLKSSSGNVLIDTGYKRKANIILDFLRDNEISLESIGLIILTHAHYDHIGNASVIREKTGAKIMLHKDELESLKNAITDKNNINPLNIWGRFLLGKISSIDTRFDVFTPDIIIDSDFALEEYGIKGKVIHTPGHSKGSISVLLDSGNAFIGDLAMNGMPLRIGAGEPVFGQNLNEIYKSWKKLLDMGAIYLYPAHGGPFKINVLKKILSRKGYI